MQASLDLVLHHLRAGQFADAERVCRAGLRDAPDHVGFLTFLGVTLHRLGRGGEALETCRRAVDHHPEALEALGNLAVLLEADGRPAQAERCLRRLQCVAPSSVLACQRLAGIRQSLGDNQQALRHKRRVVRLTPFDQAERFNLAVVLLHTGFVDEAVQAFHSLTIIAPDDAGVVAQQGASLLSLGRVEEARRLFARALHLDPDNPTARNGELRCRQFQVAMVASRHPGVPEGMLVRGPYQGLSGYAHMTGRFVDSARAGGQPVHLIGLIGDEAWSSAPTRILRGRSIVNCLIPPTVERAPGLMTVNLTMFEGTRIPLFWRRYSEWHDLVIVPTESSRVAWAERGFPEDRLRVCPLGVDLETLEGPVLPLSVNGRPVSTFQRRVLNVSDFIPRKNVDGVLRVWLTATQANDDAVLILKLGKGNPQTRAEIEALFQQTEAVIGKRRADAAPILVVDGTLDDGAMTGLFRNATHYWSLSHGEGWDLPLSKAGAMGLQLVAPAHSSYVDYLDETVARMIPSTVGSAHLPNSREPWPTFFGLDWWEPDEAVAAEIIGRIVRGEDVARLDARSRLLNRFTWAQATVRLLSILRETGAL